MVNCGNNCGKGETPLNKSETLREVLANSNTGHGNNPMQTLDFHSEKLFISGDELLYSGIGPSQPQPPNASIHLNDNSRRQMYEYASTSFGASHNTLYPQSQHLFAPPGTYSADIYR